MPYEGILTAIKSSERRLGLDVKENFIIGDASIWRYLYKASVKDVYTGLVKNSNTPKCIENWSKMLATEVDTKATFEKKSSRLHGIPALDGFSTNCCITCYPLVAFSFSESW